MFKSEINHRWGLIAARAWERLLIERVRILVLGDRRCNGARSTGTPTRVLLQPLCTQRPRQRTSPQRPGLRVARVRNKTRKLGRAHLGGSPTPPALRRFFSRFHSPLTTHSLIRIK
jgi:hypothetical protein